MFTFIFDIILNNIYMEISLFNINWAAKKKEFPSTVHYSKVLYKCVSVKENRNKY